MAAKDVSVSDNRGPAREALSAPNVGVSIYVYWLLNAVYAVWICFFVQSALISMWKSGMRLKPVGDLLSSSKPWYLREKAWGKR